MAERITWTPLAIRILREILQYWVIRNKFKNYSIKLSKLFKEATELISLHPTIGKPTDDAKVRFKIVRHYPGEGGHYNSPGTRNLLIPQKTPFFRCALSKLR